MILRHLRGIMDKGRDDPGKNNPYSASLEFEQGGIFPIREVATIGRAPDSHIVVNERSVSRHHARLFYESGHYWLKDLDSANGTTVNGKKIKLQMLSDEDKIVFGQAKAIFRAVGQAGPGPIGIDPLEGLDRLPQDGTPTDGLPDLGISSEAPTADHLSSNQPQREEGLSSIRRQLEQKKKEVQSLEKTIESLRCENERLRNLSKDGTPGALSNPESSFETLEQENRRLKRLNGQLEKALADVNLRLRNLQELYDRKSERAPKRTKGEIDYD